MRPELKINAHPNEARTGAYLKIKRIKAKPYNYVSLNWEFKSDKPFAVIDNAGFKEHMFNLCFRAHSVLTIPISCGSNDHQLFKTFPR